MWSKAAPCWSCAPGGRHRQGRGSAWRPRRPCCPPAPHAQRLCTLCGAREALAHQAWWPWQHPAEPGLALCGRLPSAAPCSPSTLCASSRCAQTAASVKCWSGALRKPLLFRRWARQSSAQSPSNLTYRGANDEAGYVGSHLNGLADAPHRAARHHLLHSPLPFSAACKQFRPRDCCTYKEVAAKHAWECAVMS